MSDQASDQVGGLWRRVGMGLLILVFLVPVALGVLQYRSRIFIFSGLAGPSETTVVAPPSPADWRTYHRGETARLAVLLTDETSAWLGLAHGLKSLGIPFTLTRDVSEALRHKVVLVYPFVSGLVLKPDELRALAAHPAAGGTLVAANVLGGGLKEIFGFGDVLPSRKRFAMSFSDQTQAWLGFDEPEEKVIRFGDATRNVEAQLGTHGYTRASDALASFDDGTAAITRRRFAGGGSAYALGFDPGFLLLIGQNARGSDIERDYINAYAPQNDLVLRLLRQVWREGEPLAVSFGRVPDGKALAVMMTFDVDFTRSLPNAVTYAEVLRDAGVRGTFFIQTKYLRDYNDEIILSDESAAYLKRLTALGMELGSHTVAHSNAFRNFPMGTGAERYPGYQPIVVSRDEARDGTVLGELRVSKFLIESLAKPVRVTSFRPGHLSNPPVLPQALEATGFRFSSSVTAGNALSHLPIRLTYDRGAEAETGIFEFPLAVEDERAPLMGLRLQQSLDVARKISRDGGIYPVLVHPNILGHKLDFVRGFTKALQGSAWFGSVEDFGSWWAARDGVDLDVSRDGDTVTVRLATRSAVHDLTIEIPSHWSLQKPNVAGLELKERPGAVTIGTLQGNATFSFRPSLRAKASL
ncbi:polysaccharide deacetylase family protein [Methylobacterium sp. J-088]|uniref:polysaccharide deacetylase family protein n=1 Tax=Methylobacterium sp. J-088 TaxID=2836664 RepID=UPI001FB86247|nr:polysaccharide deacetylase family protein [Methylobacterium sp. J-088]MCJ2066807.1 polysaccharide deacetylase family protein [Methylobacterium sp. J-088]